MERKLSRKVFEKIRDGTPAQRKYIFEHDRFGPLYFAAYYFPHFFTHPLAPFHYDFGDDINGLLNGILEEAAWIGFRECAKTSLAKTALVLYCVCLQKRRYIMWDSYDGDNSEAAVFDVANELMTNKRLISDFGRLYTKRRKKAAQEEEEGQEIRRLNKFVTENKVRVEAFSTQQSPRGRLWKNLRPDLWVLDDIENEITKESWKITSKIIRHIDALKGGLAPGAVMLYLGNYIQDEGVISHVMSVVKTLGKRGVVRFVPVLDLKKQPTWPGRFVMTDSEKEIADRAIEKPQRRKLSIEAKKRTLGATAFAVEMMLEPGADADYYFDRVRIKELMEAARDPIDIDGGFKHWGKYNPRHAYSGGSDHSSGIGADHQAYALIDISVKPNIIVTTFADNQLGHNEFAHAMYKHSLSPFGKPFLVPEANYGYACIAELVREKEEGGCGYTNIYVRQVKNRTTGKPMPTFGWWASHGTKPDLLTQFRSAVQDGELVIYDLDLLEECYRYTNSDSREITVKEGQTRHFDKMIAAALAWEGRHEAQVGGDSDDSRYKNTAQRRGEYP